MHPLLKPRFLIRLAIALGALWCAGALGAVLLHGSQNIAPLAAAASPPDEFPLLARSDRLAPLLAFDDRWQAMPHVRIADASSAATDRIRSAQRASKPRARHADRACRAKGRKHSHKWRGRCRR